MKHRTLLLSGILLVLILVGVAFGIYVKATAQPDVIAYLQERLRQQNVPVVKITILQQSPLRLQIVIQSRRDGEKATPEDPINRNLARREVILANQRGYSVERAIIVFLNNQGELVGMVDYLVNIQHINLYTSSATIDNETTKNLISDKMNLQGMTVTNMEVTSADGLQFVTLQLSTPSLETANQVILSFMDSLQPLLTEVNARGAQIATFRLELKDGQGNILLTYIIDMQTHAESGWMADGLVFPPGPPPVPE